MLNFYIPMWITDAYKRCIKPDGPTRRSTTYHEQRSKQLGNIASNQIQLHKCRLAPPTHENTRRRNQAAIELLKKEIWQGNTRKRSKEGQEAAAESMAGRGDRVTVSGRVEHGAKVGDEQRISTDLPREQIGPLWGATGEERGKDRRTRGEGLKYGSKTAKSPVRLVL
jgi:hypothetical protein